MALHKLDKTEWRAFCDRLSKALVGKHAEIEVASLALGSQVEAEWVPMLGVSYDPNDDIVVVHLEGLDHIIHAPRELLVDNYVGGFTILVVIDSENARQIVKLRDPLMLPPPART